MEIKEYSFDELSLFEEGKPTYDLAERTKEFAYTCYDVCLEVEKSYINNNFVSQLVRCSSSVAANYRAARVAQSPAAFIAKISIVLEEADEAMFWIKFMMDKKIIETKIGHELYTEAGQLVAIFKSSRLTAKSKLRK